MNVPSDFANPSASFRRAIWATIAVVGFYFICYLLLLLIGLGIGAAMCAFGVALIARLNVILVVAGAGLLVSGALIVFFPLKFIFSSNKTNYEGLTEIQEANQPELFEFVRKVSQEVGTPFPRKIFLTHEVNASVFYNSNFLSMFLPVQKNLVIGLGLVNVLNLSEFKSVLAHEFGHFSQKSMMAGSYVYQVNRAIFNMLHKTDNYSLILDKMSGFHIILSLFSRITVKVLQGMQLAQRLLYTIVNKQYNRLSREMEYHADAVAAMVAGSNNAASALKMIAGGTEFFDGTINLYNGWLKDGIRGTNVYTDQRTNAQYFAKIYGHPLVNGLPKLPHDFAFASEHQKVRIDDIWASHPTPEQRDAHLNSLAINNNTVAESAWCLFQNAKELQLRATEELYSTVTSKDQLKVAEADKYENELNTYVGKQYDDPFYHHFYEHRTFSDFDISEHSANQSIISDIQQFYRDNLLIIKQSEGALSDMETLQQLIEQPKSSRRFSYEGKVFRTKHAPEVLATVTSDHNQVTQRIKDTERLAYQYFLSIATPTEKQKLAMQHQHYFKLLNQLKNNTERLNAVVKVTAELTVEDPTDNIYSKTPPDLIKEVDALKAVYKEISEVFEQFSTETTATGLPEEMSLTERNLTTMYAGQCTAQQVNDIHAAAYQLYSSGMAATHNLKSEILTTQLAIYKNWQERSL
jgi:Zn-dependent protease with chaperone function